MRYILQFANNSLIKTSDASASWTSMRGYLRFRLTNTTPVEIYQKFADPSITARIKLVQFIDKTAIVTDEGGNQRIEERWEQDPKVHIFHDYITITSIDKVTDSESDWMLTLSSENPIPETQLEIYKEDEND